VVVQVGGTPISRAAYNHWMTIGAATVEMPKPSGALPKPVTYEPPDFRGCVAHLRKTVPMSTPTVPLRAECRATYDGIKARIINFLVSGYWLRDEAAEEGISVSHDEVKKKFEEERRAHYPTTASFERLLEASRQTVGDLEFALETQMLSAKLLAKFAKEHGDEKNEQAAVAAFNKGVDSKWILRTTCAPGYVVPDCKQYKP